MKSKEVDNTAGTVHSSEGWWKDLLVSSLTINAIYHRVDIQGHIDCIIKIMPLHKKQKDNPHFLKFVKAPLVSFQIFL